MSKKNGFFPRKLPFYFIAILFIISCLSIYGVLSTNAGTDPVMMMTSREAKLPDREPFPSIKKIMMKNNKSDNDIMHAAKTSRDFAANNIQQYAGVQKAVNPDIPQMERSIPYEQTTAPAEAVQYQGTASSFQGQNQTTPKIGQGTAEPNKPAQSKPTENEVAEPIAPSQPETNENEKPSQPAQPENAESPNLPRPPVNNGNPEEPILPETPGAGAAPEDPGIGAVPEEGNPEEVVPEEGGEAETTQPPVVDPTVPTE